ncbi:MAG: hypothetical protein JNL75_01370 [Chitinophagales bacterium]|nr:hypothetical protein [Chitinophagales bacterium]
MNNNIFIIGNGFDLSHGLDSGYKHFIDWVYKSYFLQVANKHFESNLIEFEIDNPFLNYRIKDSDSYVKGYFEDDKVFKEIFLRLKSISGYEDFYSKHQADLGVMQKIKSKTGQPPYKFHYQYEKNIMFNNIINEYHKNKNWVDIERLYFRLLISEPNTEKLNQDFEVLQNKFEEYLIQLNPLQFIPQYKDYFLNFRKYPDGNNLILNFNYTNTYTHYIPNDFQVINIHGQLNDPRNKIIFGYGDYESEDYKKLESLDDNKKLKNIKLFDYCQTDNYEKLTDKLNNPFDVHILGHSCGLSDRGLLREILNRNECVKIYVYYFQYEAEGKLADDYTDKVQNLSRCFDNKQDFIRKIKSKEDGYKMFQVQRK